MLQSEAELQEALKTNANLRRANYRQQLVIYILTTLFGIAVILLTVFWLQLSVSITALP